LIAIIYRYWRNQGRIAHDLTGKFILKRGVTTAFVEETTEDKDASLEEASKRKSFSRSGRKLSWRKVVSNYFNPVGHRLSFLFKEVARDFQGDGSIANLSHKMPSVATQNLIKRAELKQTSFVNQQTKEEMDVGKGVGADVDLGLDKLLAAAIDADPDDKLGHELREHWMATTAWAASAFDSAAQKVRSVSALAARSSALPTDSSATSSPSSSSNTSFGLPVTYSGATASLPTTSLATMSPTEKLRKDPLERLEEGFVTETGFVMNREVQSVGQSGQSNRQGRSSPTPTQPPQSPGSPASPAVVPRPGDSPVVSRRLLPKPRPLPRPRSRSNSPISDAISRVISPAAMRPILGGCPDRALAQRQSPNRAKPIRALCRSPSSVRSAHGTYSV